jgi:glucokinase
LEDLIGGNALQARYGRLPKEIDDPGVWRQEAEYLAIGLYNMMLMWSPGAIIIGGSMMRDISLDLVREKLENLPPVFPEWPQVLPAQLGNVGGLYGALELLRQHRDGQ